MASDLSPSYASQQPSRPIDDKVEKYKLKQAQFDRQITAVQQSIHDDDNDDDGSDFRFAKHRHGWFNRFFRTGDYHDIGKLLRFKKSLIRKALLKENRHLDEEAIQTFKNIMSYMGDRKSSKGPVEHAKKLLRNLMIAPGGLRDEVYMQLIKQTTDNPRPQSAVKGWELMLFCLATFPPSKGLKSFLNDYIARTTESSVPEIKAMAIKCMEFLPKIIHEGQRLHVPSKQELDKLKSREDVLIRIEMVNGDFKSFHVNPFTKVQDVTDMMSQKYNIFVTEPFALYEASSKTVNAERILDTKMRVLDVHASWENDVLLEELKIPGQEAVSKKKDAVTFDFLLFKAKLVIKTTDQKILSDPEAINLLYIQATHEVVTNRYPCKEGDITILAALQLQATFGDFQPDVHIPGWLRSNIAKYIPRHLLVDKNRVSDSLVAEWEQKVLTKYPAVAGFRTLESKLSYLDYVQEWGFYGCTFFTVGQRQFKNYPSPLTLGINSEGVLMMHPLKKSILEKYDWPDIMSWGHSDEKFIIQVGNIVQQRKLIFTTYNGKQMNNLIQEYVHYLMGEK